MPDTGSTETGTPEHPQERRSAMSRLLVGLSVTLACGYGAALSGYIKSALGIYVLAIAAIGVGFGFWLSIGALLEVLSGRARRRRKQMRMRAHLQEHSPSFKPEFSPREPQESPWNDRLAKGAIILFVFPAVSGAAMRAMLALTIFAGKALPDTKWARLSLAALHLLNMVWSTLLGIWVCRLAWPGGKDNAGS